MYSWLKSSLILGMVLSGFPHVACDCGCAAPDREQSVSACPHCAAGRARTEPERPRPCQCRQCESVSAVPAGSPVTAPSLESSRCIFAAPVGLSVRVFSAKAAEEAGRAEPIGPPLPSLCALSILLGHLLL